MNIDILKKLGNEWRAGDKHRIYFNYLETYIDLDVNYYKTGNVSAATLAGERISNSEARRLLWRLRETKVWFDLNTNQWDFKGDAELGPEIITNIEAFVAEQETA